jgi:hypothetical protein
VVEKNKALNPYIESLDRDVRKNLVWANPDDLDKAAISADLAKWHDKAKQLRADAVVLRERMKTRSPEQNTNEINWSQSWTDFYHSWDSFKAHVVECNTASSSCYWFGAASEGLDQHNQYDSNFRRLYGEYNGKFGKPATLALPKTEAEIKAEHPDTPLIGAKGSIIDIPWTPILVIAGLYFATQFIGKVGEAAPSIPKLWAKAR